MIRKTSRMAAPAVWTAIALLHLSPSLLSAADEDANRYYSGNALYNKRLYSLAIAEYSAFLSKHPSHTKAESARMGMALCQYALKKYDQSEPLLAALIRTGKVGNKRHLGVMRGQCLLKLRRWSDAAKLFGDIAAAKEQDAFTATALMGQQDALTAEKKWEAVIAVARKLAAAKDADAYLKRGLYQGASACLQLGQHHQAIPFLTQLAGLVKEDPLRFQAAFLLGECYRETGKSTEAAQQYAIAAPGLEATQAAQVYYRLGVVQFNARQYTEAISSFSNCLKKAPIGEASDEARLYMGIAALEKKDYRAALQHLQRLSGQKTAKRHRKQSAAEPNAEAVLWLARVYSRQGQYSKAAEILKNGLTQFRNSTIVPSLLFDQANALMAAKRYPEAGNALARLLQTRDWPQRNDVLRLYAVCLHHQKHYRASLPQADAFLKNYKDDPLAQEVAFVRAESLYLLNDLPKAREAYRSFLADHPKDKKAPAATLRIGTIAHRQGKWQEALDALTPLLATQPQGPIFGELAFILGDCYFRLEAWKKAIFHLERFVAAHPYDRRPRGRNPGTAPVVNLDAAMAQLGVANVNRKQPDKAMPWFSRLARDFPDSPHLPLALAELGRLQYEAGHPTAARGTLEKFLATHAKAPQRPQAEYYLAWALLADHKLSEAAAHFGVLPRQFPQHRLTPDAALQQGLALLNNKQYKEARSVLTQLQRVHPAHSKMDLATFSLGLAYAREKQWPHGASQFRNLVDKFPASDLAPRALYELAWCEKGQKRLKEATAAYNRLIQDYPAHELVPKVRTEVAELTFSARDYDAVIAQLKDNLAGLKDPALIEQTSYRLGTAYYNKNDFESCAPHFERFVEKYPNSPLRTSAQFHAGEARMRLKETIAARDHFFAVSQRKDVGNLHESTLMRLGETQGLTRQWKESATTYSRFLKQYAGSAWAAHARFGLAWALEKQQDYRRAELEYKKIIAAKKADELTAHAQFQVGECLFARKDYDNAIQELVRVTVDYRYPDWSAKALLEVGRALEAKGDTPKAMTQFREVMKKYPSHSAAVVAKQRLDILRRTQ